MSQQPSGKSIHTHQQNAAETTSDARNSKKQITHYIMLMITGRWRLSSIIKDAYYAIRKAQRLDGKVLCDLCTGRIARLTLGGFNATDHAFWFEDDRGQLVEFANIPEELSDYLEDERGHWYIVCDDEDINPKAIYDFIRQYDYDRLRETMREEKEQAIRDRII